MENFQDYAYYYNMFYGDKDYKTESTIVKSIIERVQTEPVSSILNLGCGTGKHDIELIKLGYKVDGIDLSDKMIEIAKTNNPQSKYDVADVRDYETEKSYDMVLSMFHVTSYQNCNDDVIKMFKTANRALKENGLFLFDLWYGPGVLSDLPTKRIKKVENEEKKAIRYATPMMHYRENVVDVIYDVFIIDKETGLASELEEVHKMRYFFSPEIELMLSICGFELVDSVDCSTLAGLNEKSWTAYFIAKKRNEV